MRETAKKPSPNFYKCVTGADYSLGHYGRSWPKG